MKKIKFSPMLLAVVKQYRDCLVTLLFAFLNGLIISIVLSLPIGLILGESSNLADALVALLGTLITVFLSSCKKGYYFSRFKFSQLFIGIILTFATQIILVLMGHSAWFSGPAMFWGSYLFEVINPEAVVRWNVHGVTIENYRWIFVIALYWFAYVPLMILGKYLGAKKSKRDFKKSKEEKVKEKAINEHPFDM